MKILITGGNGVVGSYLVKKLKDHDLYKPSSKFLDFADREHVDGFFNSHSKFDVVIHCAIRGGSRLKVDRWNVLDDNIKMYYNILHNRHKYNKLISFGSGAEIHQLNTPYGISKNAVAKSIIDQDNVYNLRIYSLFGDGEFDTRFIRANLLRYTNKESMEFYQNKLMDFFYMEDLWKLVKYYIDTENPPKEVDCSYKFAEKNLFNILEKINTLDEHKVSILDRTSEHEKQSDYIGNPETLSNLPIELIGLDNGLKLEYEKYKFCN
jgi:GDP-L-fucose synthase